MKTYLCIETDDDGWSYYDLANKYRHENLPSDSVNDRPSAYVFYNTELDKKFWCKDGRYHRLAGPAIIFYDGRKEEYWINNKYYEFKEQWQKKIKSCKK